MESELDNKGSGGPASEVQAATAAALSREIDSTDPEKEQNLKIKSSAEEVDSPSGVGVGSELSTKSPQSSLPDTPVLSSAISPGPKPPDGAPPLHIIQKLQDQQKQQLKVFKDQEREEKAEKRRKKEKKRQKDLLKLQKENEKLKQQLMLSESISMKTNDESQSEDSKAMKSVKALKAVTIAEPEPKPTAPTKTKPIKGGALPRPAFLHVSDTDTGSNSTEGGGGRRSGSGQNTIINSSNTVKLLPKLLNGQNTVWRLPYNGKGPATKRVLAVLLCDNGDGNDVSTGANVGSDAGEGAVLVRFVALSELVQATTSTTTALARDRLSMCSMKTPITLCWYDLQNASDSRAAGDSDSGKVRMLSLQCLNTQGKDTAPHVVTGHATPAFTKVLRRHPHADPSALLPRPELCFSVVTSTRTLDLAAESPHEAQAWVASLKYLISLLPKPKEAISASTASTPVTGTGTGTFTGNNGDYPITTSPLQYQNSHAHVYPHQAPSLPSWQRQNLSISIPPQMDQIAAIAPPVAVNQVNQLNQTQSSMIMPPMPHGSSMSPSHVAMANSGSPFSGPGSYPASPQNFHAQPQGTSYDGASPQSNSPHYQLQPNQGGVQGGGRGPTGPGGFSGLPSPHPSPSVSPQHRNDRHNRHGHGHHTNAFQNQNQNCSASAPPSPQNNNNGNFYAYPQTDHLSSHEYVDNVNANTYAINNSSSSMVNGIGNNIMGNGMSNFNGSGIGNGDGTMSSSSMIHNRVVARSGSAAGAAAAGGGITYGYDREKGKEEEREKEREKEKGKDREKSGKVAVKGVGGWKEKLFSAASSGDVVAFQDVLLGGAPVDTPIGAAPGSDASRSDPSGRVSDTPLLIAARMGHVNVLKACLEAGAKNDPYGEGMTALHHAVSAGQLEAAEVLLYMAAAVSSEAAMTVCNIADSVGRTAAHVAAELGALKSNNNKKKSLTAKNGSTQSRADSGRRGASEKDVSLSLALLELLVFHGADLKLQTVETDTEKKRTCLHLAAEAGNVDHIEAILEYDDETMDMQDKDGATALFLCVQNNDIAGVRLLLHSGAGPFLKDSVQKRTPLELAVAKGYSSIGVLLLEYQTSVEEEGGGGGGAERKDKERKDKEEQEEEEEEEEGEEDDGQDEDGGEYDGNEATDDVGVFSREVETFELHGLLWVVCEYVENGQALTYFVDSQGESVWEDPRDFIDTASPDSSDLSIYSPGSSENPSSPNMDVSDRDNEMGIEMGMGNDVDVEEVSVDVDVDVDETLTVDEPVQEQEQELIGGEDTDRDQAVVEIAAEEVGEVQGEEEGTENENETQVESEVPAHTEETSMSQRELVLLAMGGAGTGVAVNVKGGFKLPDSEEEEEEEEKEEEDEEDEGMQTLRKMKNLGVPVEKIEYKLRLEGKRPEEIAATLERLAIEGVDDDADIDAEDAISI